MNNSFRLDDVHRYNHVNMCNRLQDVECYDVGDYYGRMILHYRMRIQPYFHHDYDDEIAQWSR